MVERFFMSHVVPHFSHMRGLWGIGRGYSRAFFYFHYLSCFLIALHISFYTRGCLWHIGSLSVIFSPFILSLSVCLCRLVCYIVGLCTRAAKWLCLGHCNSIFTAGTIGHIMNVQTICNGIHSILPTPSLFFKHLPLLTFMNNSFRIDVQ